MGSGQWLKGKPLPALGDFGVKPAGDLAGGKRIAVCFCDLQQRPSRHAVETLAARAELWKQEGLVVVLIIPGGEAGTASANWLKDRKATFTVGRLPADEGQAGRILAGWGVTALPHIVVADASHTVTAEAVAADALEAILKDSTGATQPAPAAVRPAFYSLAGLDEAIRQYKKGLDPVEQERLQKMDNHWKQDLERGWKPPWSNLAANLTDREIESLSTAELGRKLFDNGLSARTLMLYNSTNTGIKRLEVLYKGYKELFHRSDCWKGLIASLDYYAAQLAVSGKATDNVNAIAGMMTVPKFYSYPAIRVNITGHEREIIAAHVRALRRISAYLNASAASTGTGQPKAFFAPMAPSALINWSLALGQGLSEQQYQAARAALANPKWAKGIPAGDVRAYIDEAAIILDRFTSTPLATQPAESPLATPPAASKARASATSTRQASYSWQGKINETWLTGLWMRHRTDNPGPGEANIVMRLFNPDGSWAMLAVWGDPRKPTKVKVENHGAKCGLQSLDARGATLATAKDVNDPLTHESPLTAWTMITRVTGSQLVFWVNVDGMEYTHRNERCGPDIQAVIGKALVGSGVIVGKMPEPPLVDWPGLPDKKMVPGTWFHSQHSPDKEFVFLTIKPDSTWIRGRFYGGPENPTRIRIDQRGPQWRLRRGFAERPEISFRASPSPERGNPSWSMPILRITPDELTLYDRRNSRASPELAATLASAMEEPVARPTSSGSSIPVRGAATSPSSGLASAARPATLQEQLYDVDQLCGTGAMATGEVERRVAALCSQYPKDMWGRVYATAAFTYAQSGKAYQKKAITFCRQALTEGVDPVSTARLYVYYGDAVQLSSSGTTEQDRAKAHHLAWAIYLHGLKYLQSQNLPEKLPDLPKLGPAGVIIGSDPVADAQREQEARKCRQEWERVKLQRDLIQYREILKAKINEMSSEGPCDPAELERLAKEALAELPPVDELDRRPEAKATQPAPAGPATQPARCLRLILLDDAGKPVEGADVSIANSTNPKKPAEGKTDAQGRCAVTVTAIQADRWVFKTTKAGYIPLRTSMRAASAEKLFAEETTLRITKGQTIGGGVRNEQGQPIKDVILGFSWFNPNRARQPVTADMDVTQVRTDADGKWVCDFAPPKLGDSDHFCIFLRHPEYISDHWTSGYALMPRFPRPSLKELQSRTAVYVMKAGVLLAGKVTDAQSKPVSGAQVRIMEGSDCGYGVRAVNGRRTKVDGSFTFKDAESPIGSVIVTAKGFAPDIFPFEVGKDAPLVITLAPGGVIRGKVIDARGMPVAGAGVYVGQWRGQQGLLAWGTQSDKAGCFTWSDAPADGATFSVYKEGYMQQDDVAIKPSETEQFITLSDPLRITGCVLDAETDKPIGGARVIYGIDWGQGSSTSWDRRRQMPVKDGKYQIEITDSHKAFVLRAEAEGYKPAVSESIPRDAGRRIVDFRLHKAKPIVGKVLGLEGKPLAGVEMHVTTVGNGVCIRNGTRFEYRDNDVKTTTATDGSFSFPPDDKDFIIVIAIDAGYAEVSSAGLEKAPDILLEPWGRIEGAVKQGAKPLPNASVVASAVGSRETPMVYRETPMVYHDLCVTADALWRFVMPCVAPGQYQVCRQTMVGNMGLYICHEKITVEAGKTTAITIGGKGRTVIARLNRPGPAGDDIRTALGGSIIDAASEALNQQMVNIHPANWDKMDAAQCAEWNEQWRQSEEGKAFMKRAEGVRKNSKRFNALLHPDGRVEAFDVPPSQYVLNVSLARIVGGQYVSEGTVRKTFEVPEFKGNDLDTPLDLGTLKVIAPEPEPAQTAAGPSATTDQTAPTPPSAAQAVMNQPLKLDLAAGLAGRKLLVIAASIEQRPSRRLLDTLAAQADGIAKQGYAIVLVHAAATDEAQVKKWLADRKLDVAQVILVKDQADVAKLMAACGAESLPFMLLTDDKHVGTAVDVRIDQLARLDWFGQTPPATKQSTTSPAAAEAGGAK